MKQILCFGDSNTYGLIPGTLNRYDWGVRWSSILTQKLSPEKYHVIEEGLCGRTTVFDDVFRAGRRGSELLPILLESHAPLDLVILMLGTNDCKTVYQANAEVIGKGMEVLLQQIRQQSPSASVLLVSPIHLGEGVWEDGFDKEFNEASVEVSKDLGRVYERIARERNLFYLNASAIAAPSDIDREHLDETGHRLLAEAIYRKVQEILH